MTHRALAAFEGKALGAHHSFASPDLLWQTLTRIALYARYSSDQQSASSIDDQLRICRKQAAREG